VCFCSGLNGRSVEQGSALEVAEFHLQVWDMQSSFTIRNTSALTGVGGTLAYVINLNPTGFIVVSSDTDIVSIIAYSF
jgi:hypothetical protein